jgi:hypothetical protein
MSLRSAIADILHITSVLLVADSAVKGLFGVTFFRPSRVVCYERVTKKPNLRHFKLFSIYGQKKWKALSVLEIRYLYVKWRLTSRCLVQCVPLLTHFINMISQANNMRGAVGTYCSYSHRWKIQYGYTYILRANDHGNIEIIEKTFPHPHFNLVRTLDLRNRMALLPWYLRKLHCPKNYRNKIII